MTRICCLLLVLLFQAYPLAAQRSLVASEPTTNDRFPKKVGNLRFSDSVLKLGKVRTNELRSDTLKVLNTATSSIRWELPKDVPTHLRISLSGEELASGSEGWIAIRYDAREKNDFGQVFDRLIFSTTDTDLPQKVITISANITEYFAPLSTEDSAVVQRSRIPEPVGNRISLRASSCVQHFQSGIPEQKEEGRLVGCWIQSNHDRECIFSQAVLDLINAGSGHGGILFAGNRKVFCQSIRQRIREKRQAGPDAGTIVAGEDTGKGFRQCRKRRAG